MLEFEEKLNDFISLSAETTLKRFTAAQPAAMSSRGIYTVCGRAVLILISV